jgi:hypothetical protein
MLKRVGAGGLALAAATSPGNSSETNLDMHPHLFSTYTVSRDGNYFGLLRHDSEADVSQSLSDHPQKESSHG